MKYFIDILGRKIRLTEERESHIKSSHPELNNQLKKIRETLLQPHRIVRSASDEGVQLYYRLFTQTPVGTKYLCVVVKSVKDDYFILTVYFTDTIKRGELLWIMENK